MRSALVVVLAPTLAAHPSLRAQETVPGVRVELVQLDAVVTDKAGKLVRDLKAEDFVVLEDGKPQKLTLFSPGGRRRAGAAPAMGEGATVTAMAAPAPTEGGPPRHVALVVDDLHIAADHLEHTKRAITRFLDEFVAEDDQVMLVTTSSSRTASWTSGRVRLRQDVAALTLREATVAPAASSQMTPAQAEMILSGDRSALRLAAKTMTEEPGTIYDAVRDSPRSVLERPGPEVSGTGLDDTRDVLAANEAVRQAGPILAEALRFSVATMRVVDQVLRNLGSRPGRKICLLISDGFLMGTGTREERTREMQGVIDAATRSGAVVYALDSRGLVGGGGDASLRGVSARLAGADASMTRQAEQLQRATLQRVADGTGGFLVTRTNDLATGLRQMLDDNETYYLMAYEPTNPRREGRFRKIEVRLPRHAGFTVRTRRGYLEPDDRRPSPSTVAASAPVAAPAAAPAPDSLSQEEARALLNAPPPADGIPVRLTADYVDLPPAGPQAVVHAHVDTAKLAWREEGGRRRADVDLIGGVYDASGNAVAAPFGRRTQIDAGASDLERARATGLEFQHRVPLAPGRYEVRFLAREVGTARAGGATQPLHVPDLGDKKLMLSGVFLSAASTKASEGETLRDAQARRAFGRGGNVSFQLYVYNAAVDDKGTSDVVLQAQVWSGGKVIAASKPQPAALQVEDGVPLPETNVMSLEGLDPGAYELRVVVVDRRAKLQATRRTDFTVE